MRGYMPLFGQTDLTQRLFHPDPGRELTEVPEDLLNLQKVVDFLESLEEDKQQGERFYHVACRLDRMCFFIYLLMCILYFCVLTYMFTSYPCEIEHFNFWY